MTEEEARLKAEKEAADKAAAESKAIEAIKLEDDDTSSIEARLKSDFPDLIGEDLDKKRKELASETKKSIYDQVKKDGELFETIKAEADWKGKSEDEIWEEVGRRNEEAESSSSLDDLLGTKSEKKDKPKGEGGNPDLQKELAEAKEKLQFYEQAFEKDTMLKSYTEASKAGQAKKFIELVSADPVITMDIEKLDGKALYEAHLNAMRRQYGDTAFTEEQIREKVDRWDSMDGEERIPKIEDAKKYLQARQADLHKQIDNSVSEMKPRKLDKTVVAKMFADSLEKVKGTTKMGVKIDDAVAKEVFEHIASGKFNTHDPKTGLPIPERVIEYALLDLKKADMGRNLYNAGVRDAEKRNAKKHHRSKSLYQNGLVRTSGGKSSWDKKKENEGKGEGINMSV